MEPLWHEGWKGTTRRQNGRDKKGPGKLGEASCHKKTYFYTNLQRKNKYNIQQVENWFPPQSYWNEGIPFFPLQSLRSQSTVRARLQSLKPSVHRPPFLLSCHSLHYLLGLLAFSWMGNNRGMRSSQPASQRMPICSDRGLHSALWTESASGLLTYE